MHDPWRRKIFDSVLLRHELDRGASRSAHLRTAAASVIGGPVAGAAVALMYLAFAGFVVMLKVRGIETAGCGCFGQESDDPPGSLHIAVDVVAAAIAGAAIITPIPDIATVLADQPLWGVPYVGFVALGVWLLMVMLTDLPRLMQLSVRPAS